MVDEIRVLRLLRAIRDDLAVLRSEASADPGRQADPLWLRGVKYDGIVVTRLANLSDLDDFVAAIAGWVMPAGS